ncbi:MAG: ImmA/IrrE family metallo-endopeptidase [Turicibacter sp.]|nr:ImmA/IrrE family metallo-endopeptidase [Turicibacter sp.]
MGSIEEKAQKLIQSHGTNCPFALAKMLKIQVIFEPLGKALGYYNRSYRIKMIHINEMATEKQSRFICAHELGHSLLHPEENTPFLKKHTYFSTNRIEREANDFAKALLFGSLTEDDEGITLEELQTEYRVDI